MATKAKTQVGAKAPTEPVYKAGVWECPQCHNRVGVFVKMTSPPACWNHRNKNIVVMERKGK